MKTEHFKLEDLRSAINLIFPDCFMCTIDLQDAYFTIPIHKDSKRFLRFSFNGKIYQFICLPFGLCTAPYIFTKIMKVPIQNLRLRGFIIVNYLDDMLIIAPNEDICRRRGNITCNFLRSLASS